jgi:acyl carrier protein
MSTLQEVVQILGTTLQLGERKDRLRSDSPLLGSLPEFDSMAVVSVITALEDRFGFTVDDDEISAETFETVGSLSDFVEQKLAA